MPIQHARWSRWLAWSFAGVGALTLVGATSLAYSAGARRLTPPPAVIATFDLQRVFTGMEERTAKEAELKAEVDRLQKEVLDLGNAAKDQEDKSKALADGPQKQAALAKAYEMAMNAEVKKKVAEGVLAQKQAQTFVELFNRVTAAAQGLAKQNNYTMVISSDDKAMVPDQATTQDIQRVMQLKRVFYAAPGHDISDDLVTMLNNEFKARAGKPNG